jgi:hypothetical protein
MELRGALLCAAPNGVQQAGRGGRLMRDYEDTGRL